MRNSFPESETKRYIENIAVQLESFQPTSEISQKQLQELLEVIGRGLKTKQFGYLELKYLNQTIEQLIVESTLWGQKIF
ncbi:hypothetical protein [Streptococcus sanguinis]|uniref:hypothetical protein n=1 Tax=Streptococcus sanguinis TaxID=1305 RepID=UPI001D1428D5|nr:hypothetical protein [Streptococcus sanguinis]MCC3172168.1 hypothetical protein [Streptococcus sanguinis]